MQKFFLLVQLNLQLSLQFASRVLFIIKELIFLLTQKLRDSHQMIREFENVIDLKEIQEAQDIEIWVLRLLQTPLHCVGGTVNLVIVAALDSFSG